MKLFSRCFFIGRFGQTDCVLGLLLLARFHMWGCGDGFLSIGNFVSKETWTQTNLVHFIHNPKESNFKLKLVAAEMWFSFKRPTDTAQVVDCKEFLCVLREGRQIRTVTNQDHGIMQYFSLFVEFCLRVLKARHFHRNLELLHSTQRCFTKIQVFTFCHRWIGANSQWSRKAAKTDHTRQAYNSPSPRIMFKTNLDYRIRKNKFQFKVKRKTKTSQCWNNSNNQNKN